MAHILVVVDGRELFNDEVPHWNPPPDLPPNPNPGTGIADLPPIVRAALAKALARVMEKTTGFKVTVT